MTPTPSSRRTRRDQNSGLWNEPLELLDRLGLMIEERDGGIVYASQIGAFPRNYEVLMLKLRSRESGRVGWLPVDRVGVGFAKLRLAA